MRVLVNSRSGVMPISVDLMQGLERELSGRAHMTSFFEEQARAKNALSLERSITIQTMPLTPAMDTTWGVVEFKAPFVVLPGERRLIILGQKILREQLSLYILGVFGKIEMERSNDGTTPEREHKDKPLKVKENGVGPEDEWNEKHG